MIYIAYRRFPIAGHFHALRACRLTLLCSPAVIAASGRRSAAGVPLSLLFLLCSGVLHNA
jgi:hypothetical protein